MARKTSFYYAFLVLPDEQRRAIMAVWDFCRAVDDAIDEVEAGPPQAASSPVPAGRAAMAFWRQELAACFEGARPETPQARGIQPFVQRLDLPRQPFDDVIDGVEMDLDRSRYETFDELFEYCRRVASAVGMICIRIFGCTQPRSEDYALNLGVALQLTNILRDVATDLDRGRVYLPLEDLSAHGCSVGDLDRRVMTGPLRRLLAFECDRARRFYQRAVEARPPEDRSRLVAAEIMRAVYYETLHRIERVDYDVFTHQTRVPKPKQAMIAMRQWLFPA